MWWLRNVFLKTLRDYRVAILAWLAANRALGDLDVRFDVAAERARRLEVVQDAF